MGLRMKHDTVKRARAVEISFEALTELIRERFPDLFDWENMKSIPALDISNRTHMLNLQWGDFFTYSGDELYSEEFEPTPFAFRRLGEGAPVPSTHISTLNLFTNVFVNDESRCGYRINADEAFLYPSWSQCELPRAHEGEHGKSPENSPK